MTDKYDRGPEPEPGVTVRWEKSRAGSAVDDELERDLSVLVHRFNNWIAACDEIDRLRELLAELPGLVRADRGSEPFSADEVADAIEARIREVG